MKNKHEDNHQCFDKDEYEERHSLPDSKINFKASVIKAVWLWYRIDWHMEQLENPETDSVICKHMVYNYCHRNSISKELVEHVNKDICTRVFP